MSRLKKTTLLILLCILATLSSAMFGEDLPLDMLYFSGENLSRGFFWTPITALFFHASMAHLIGNMLFLYVFGGTLEREVGSSRTMLAFFSGGTLSFILSLHFYGYKAVMMGASAAIFTLVAIVMLVKPLKFSWLFLMPLGLVAMLYFIYNVFAIYYPHIGGLGVGYWGHVIGFLIGVPFGVAWSRGRWKRNLLISIGLLIIYFMLVS